jgi:hypothetical protein
MGEFDVRGLVYIDYFELIALAPEVVALLFHIFTLSLSVLLT